MERSLLPLISRLRAALPVSRKITRNATTTSTPQGISSVQEYPLSSGYDGVSTSQHARPRERIKAAKPFSSFLTDNYSRQHDYLRISITERCNLRCTYCMPEEGVPLSPLSHLLTTPEISYLSSLFVSQGVTKIRLTGGEPTIRPDILPLMHAIGELRRDGLQELCITTNGITLRRKLDSMVDAGLTGVNLSLDTLDPFQFQIMTRRMGFEAVMKSIDRILEMNRLGARIKLKINCVVMRGINEGEIIPFVEMGREKDLEVRFIEYMPFEGNKWNQEKMLSFQEMLGIIREKYPKLEKVQDHKNDTSKTFRVPGFVGKVGFITSMTHNFCGTCNRLRITSDGNLKVCLFGNTEVSLRDLLRKDSENQAVTDREAKAMKWFEMDRKKALSGAEASEYGRRERELLDLIGMAVRRKKEKHAGMGQLENMKNRPMILIGMERECNMINLADSIRCLDDLSSQVSPVSFPISDPWVFGSSLFSNPIQNLSRTLNNSASPSLRRNFSKIVHSPKPDPTSEDSTSSTASSNSSVQPISIPHLNSRSEVHLVPISVKHSTPRSALAIGHITFSTPRPVSLIRAHALVKGDVLAVARVAAITAIKKTSDIIPLCHNGVPVEGVQVRVEVVGGVSEFSGSPPSRSTQFAVSEGDAEEAAQRLTTPLPPHGGVRIAVRVDTTAKTGVEMEALCGVFGAGLAVVDMCKAVDRGLSIEGVRVVGKKGGRSGGWGIWEGKS